MTATNEPIVISAMGHYFPPNVISNDFFHSLDIGSSSQWIEERTGIKSRAMVLEPREIVALKEGKTTLEEIRSSGFAWSIANFAKASVDNLADGFAGKEGRWMLICGTSVADWCIPANACAIAEKIGLSAVSVDVNSACSSFIVNLHFARQMLVGAMIDKVLICNPERYSLRLNYHDRGSCTLFGDGSACAIVGRGLENGLEVIDSEVHSNPYDYDKVTIADGGTFCQQGRAVQKFAITHTVEATRSILQRNDMSINEVNYFIGHQANKRMLDTVAEKLNLSAEQHLFNVVEYGNQGAAGAPNVLSQNWQRFRAGDIIVVTVVGSGLTWGSAIFRCK